MERHYTLPYQQLNTPWDNYDKLLTTHVSASQKQRLDANMVNYHRLRHDPQLKQPKTNET